MPLGFGDEEEEEERKAPKGPPVEPNGEALTLHRLHLADTLRKMTKVSDAINARLRAYAGQTILEKDYERTYRRRGD